MVEFCNNWYLALLECYRVNFTAEARMACVETENISYTALMSGVVSAALFEMTFIDADYAACVLRGCQPDEE